MGWEVEGWGGVGAVRWVGNHSGHGVPGAPARATPAHARTAPARHEPAAGSARMPAAFRWRPPWRRVHPEGEREAGRQARVCVRWCGGGGGVAGWCATFVRPHDGLGSAPRKEAASERQGPRHTEEAPPKCGVGGAGWPERCGARPKTGAGFVSNVVMYKRWAARSPPPRACGHGVAWSATARRCCRRYLRPFAVSLARRPSSRTHLTPSPSTRCGCVRAPFAAHRVQRRCGCGGGARGAGWGTCAPANRRVNAPSLPPPLKLTPTYLPFPTHSTPWRTRSACWLAWPMAVRASAGGTRSCRSALYHSA